VSVNDGTNNERVNLLQDSNNYLQFLVADGAVNQASITSTVSMLPGVTGSYVGVSATNDFESYESGQSIGTDTSGTVPAVDTIEIGSQANGGQPNGHIRNVKIYNRRLNDTQVSNL
jgi:hypothetical protein